MFSALSNIETDDCSNQTGKKHKHHVLC
jgi:hypothetical protein